MKTGKVKFFNETKGYGFIKCDDGTEVFVHKTGLEVNTLREGEKVSFEIVEGKKGLNAVNVNKNV